MNPLDTITPQEVIAVGPKPINNRRLLKTLGFAAVVAMAAAGTVGHMASKTSFSEQLSAGPEETHQAQVVAKVMWPEGHQLGEKNAWQSDKDVPGAAHYLVLNVPGEIETATVAVSQDVYNSYCQNPKMPKKSNNEALFGGCGAIVNSIPAPTAAERNAPLDKIQISFTRGDDGSLQVTQLGEHEQFKTGLVDLLQLRRESKQHLDQSETMKARANKMG